MKYQITSKAGVDYGIWDAESPCNALAQMHRDAGCECHSRGDYIVFANDDDESVCGQPEDWIIEQTEASKAAQALRAIPSEKRAAAARENGKKGGRPRNPT